jgi:hypothetical protein
MSTPTSPRSSPISGADRAGELRAREHGDDGTKAVALAQSQRVGRTIDCLHDLYLSDLATKQSILQEVRNALYDNAMRLRAYNHASTLVSGTILRAGRGCDAAITGVSQ